MVLLAPAGGLLTLGDPEVRVYDVHAGAERMADAPVKEALRYDRTWRREDPSHRRAQRFFT